MKIIISIFIFIISSFTMVYADRGFITFERDVKVFEPNQHAFIAWDGKQEILLLSTDMSASQPTKVLEIIPLPSEPIVTKGEIEVFGKATDLINRKIKPDMRLLLGAIRGEERGIIYGEEKPEPPAGKVTFHEKIGVNDISVIQVLETSGFIEWVEKYLVAAGVNNPIIPEDLKNVVTGYLKDNFTWFVFDVIELDNTTKTPEVIQYRFLSDYLFYPLKISSQKEGNTDITLLILTPQLLSKFSGLPVEHIQLLHEPIDVSTGELKEISDGIYNLLGKPSSMTLRTWKINGALSSFNEDLVASGFVSSEVSQEYYIKHLKLKKEEIPHLRPN